MQEEYSLENEHVKSAGKSRGHFMIDLCRPVHLTLCLRSFQDSIHCTDDNWDAQFGALLPLCVCGGWGGGGGGGSAARMAGFQFVCVYVYHGLTALSNPQRPGRAGPGNFSALLVH